MLSEKERRGLSLLGGYSALWGDEYALTMAQALFTHGEHLQHTTFHAFIRNNPFKGSYLVTAGQAIALNWLAHHWRFDEDDIAMMREKRVPDLKTGELRPLYTPEFIDMCARSKLELNIDAMREGEIAFPDEPIYRVSGPAWQCLMVEAALLNILNSQSLFATLASRLVQAAEGAPILEFGTRRAQCIGGLEPTIGAYIGGAIGTSNMLGQKYFGIPSMGTFAHALVMLYQSELEAFQKYASAMPNSTVFLVDTYDTLEGVKKAIEACRAVGVKMKGIRLDSGDLAYLSIEARKLLDAAGFESARIYATNDLDETTIESLKRQGSKIDVWGVGTRLATSYAQPALGSVYKVGAIFERSVKNHEDAEYQRSVGINGGENTIRPVIKLSEQTAKVSIPGELDVVRYVTYGQGRTRFDGDTIYTYRGQDAQPVSAELRLTRDMISVRKDDETRRKTFAAGTRAYLPLKPMMRDGKLVMEIESVHQARRRAQKALGRMHETHRRLLNPHEYVVGLEEDLWNKRRAMIINIRGSR